jgi:hypothetical protein
LKVLRKRKRREAQNPGAHRALKGKRGARKKKLTRRAQSSQRRTERSKARVGEKEPEALDRKNPPFAKGAKDGAPGFC